MREISVLLLTTSYPLHERSVSGVFVQRLAQAISRRCRTQVLAPDDPQGISQREDGQLRISTFRYAPRRFQRLAHGAGGIPAVLRHNRACIALIVPFLSSMLMACWYLAPRYDVLFANWSGCGVVAGIVGYLRGRPVVVVLRGQDANRIDSNRLLRFALYVCIRLCDRVVTVSQAMANALGEHIPEYSHKLAVIPNGVSSEFLDIPASSRTRSQDSALNLLCIASLIPGKSVATLIQALALLPSEVRLMLVGEGPESMMLIEFARSLEVHERIEFLPFQAPARLPALFSQADAFVLPSLSEGRPNVVLEAFAASRPVIASDIDGVRELIGNHQRGMLFPPGDASELANCIRKIFNTALRQAMGEKARQYIIDEGLTWENAARCYEELFIELVK